jgi:hypothetical protein
LTSTRRFDLGLGSIWAAHLAMDDGRGCGLPSGGGQRRAVAGRRQLAGVARIRAPGGQTRRDKHQKEAKELRNSPRGLKRRETRRTRRSSGGAPASGRRSGGGVGAREERRGAMRGEEEALGHLL